VKISFSDFLFHYLSSIIFLHIQLKSDFTLGLNSSVRINSYLQNLDSVPPIAVDCCTNSAYKSIANRVIKRAGISITRRNF